METIFITAARMTNRPKPPEAADQVTFLEPEQQVRWPTPNQSGDSSQTAAISKEMAERKSAAFVLSLVVTEWNSLFFLVIYNLPSHTTSCQIMLNRVQILG